MAEAMEQDQTVRICPTGHRWIISGKVKQCPICRAASSRNWKKNHPRPRNPRKLISECKRGHPMVPENLRPNRRGRECLECHRTRYRGFVHEPQRGRSPFYPCGHPRTAENRVANGNECAVCNRARSLANYRANPSIGIAKAMIWAQRNRHRLNERVRRWRRANPSQLARMSIRRYGASGAELIDYATILKFDPCSYCGGSAGTLDHIEPVSTGGPTEWMNLTASCQSCNSSKNNKSLLTLMIDRVLINGTRKTA